MCCAHLSSAWGRSCANLKKQYVSTRAASMRWPSTSGTSALHLAVRALKLERGAEVILPSFTFSALLNVILQEGLRPKFVDIDPGTYNTTTELVAAAITPRKGLIISVHTFGFPMD